jgi:hypothetical protein
LGERFDPSVYTVTDRITNLVWCRDAGISEFPLTWVEAFDFTASLNRDSYGGVQDWRLPNRQELFSLVSHAVINPVLPAGHPFINVFNGYYWSAGTCARLPSQAWYVHFGGGKVYRGMKQAANMVWPVRDGLAGEGNLFSSGQNQCYDEKGAVISCENVPMQSAAVASGKKWPSPRFSVSGEVAIDGLTGLTWTIRASVHGKRTDRFLTWQEAGSRIKAMNREGAHGFDDWRLPGIRELERLADLSMHSPALPAAHPFTDVSDFYWSQNTSRYEERYAWTFYMKDGAVGVGFKENPEFSLWPVRGKIDPDLF